MKSDVAQKRTDSHTSGFCADFFVLRTPLLPFEAWRSLSKDSSARGGGAECGDETGGATRRVLLGRLSTLLARPEVREAMWLSSPESLSLAEAVAAGKQEPGERVVATLVACLG